MIFPCWHHLSHCDRPVVGLFVKINLTDEIITGVFLRTTGQHKYNGEKEHFHEEGVPWPEYLEKALQMVTQRTNLFPLNSSGRFRGAIINNSGHSLYFITYPRRDSVEKAPWNLGN